MMMIRLVKISLLLLLLDSAMSQFDFQASFPSPFQNSPLNNRFANIQQSANALLQKYFKLYVSSPYIQIPKPQGRAGEWIDLYQPNITRIGKKCPRKGLYATFNPDHQSAVEEMVALYHGKDDIDSILEFSQFLKTNPEVHPHVWYASFLRAQTTLWPNYLNMDRPNPVHLFPSTFFPEGVISQYRQMIGQSGRRQKRQLFSFPMFGFGQQSNPFGPQPFSSQGNQPGQNPQPIGPQNPQQVNAQPQNPQPAGPQGQNPQQAGPQAQRQCLVLDERFGQDNGIENRLWYFREDVQLNAHHWTWHLLYPTSARQPIPRRGEFFFFFHHDLLSRYSAERIANGFDASSPNPLVLQVDSTIDEGYNPHMADGISTMPWAPRPPSQRLQNALPRPVFDQLVATLQNRDRILEVLSTGTVIQGQQRIPINTFDAINVLGELTEASAQSINPQVYGLSGLHNDGHWIMANLIGNFPQGTMGVMGHSATAMRDMMFYRWHKYIDSLFRSYKSTHLAPYPLTGGDLALVLPGIRVAGVNVNPDDSRGTANVLRTFWNTRNFDLAGGLDYNLENFQQAPNVNVCAKHLDHEEFSYRLQIENARQGAVSVMIRIYMAPRFRSLNGQDRFSFEEQRNLFFTMDSYVQTLQPGNNVIVRRSIESTLTAPWPRSIQALTQDIQNGDRRGHCECGFPHHLLLPKGTEQGMAFDLFVFVTDAAGGVTQAPTNPQQCEASYIHCGLAGRAYPDAKPMGYPFDRQPYFIATPVQGPNGNTVMQAVAPRTLEEYVSNIPNSGMNQVVITHQNIQLGQ